MDIKIRNLVGHPLLVFSWELESLIREANDYLDNLDEMYIICGDPFRDDLKTTNAYPDQRLGMISLIESLGWHFEISDEDIEWTRSRNEGLRHVRYHGMRLKDSYKLYIKQKLEQFISCAEEELKRFEILDAKQKADREEIKEKFLRGIKWKTECIDTIDEGGKTKEFVHTITIEGENFVFKERNVFDVGRVINPKDGGLVHVYDNTHFVGIHDGDAYIERKMSAAESRAYEAVRRYGEYADSIIRM